MPRAGVSYFGYNLPNDAADFYNQGVSATLLPERRHAAGAGCYSCLGAYGENFDPLKPNLPGRADVRALANYDVPVSGHVGVGRQIRTTVCRDGISNDCAWWAAARLIAL